MINSLLEIPNYSYDKEKKHLIFIFETNLQVEQIRYKTYENRS